MEIASLRVSGIRCFDDSGWITLRDISVLVGENDSGKSTLLDAIAFALGQPAFDASDLHRTPQGGQVDAAEVSIRLRLSASEIAELPGGIPRADDEVVEVSRAITLSGPSTWRYVGKVPQDEALRVDPATTNINALRGLLRSHGVEPVGLTKPPIVSQFEQMIDTLPKVTGRVATTHPLHLGKFSIADFRSASDPVTIVRESLRSVFSDYISRSQKKTAERVRDGASKYLKRRVDELAPYLQRYRTGEVRLHVPFDIDLSRGLQIHEIEVEESDVSVPLSRRGEGIKRHLQLAAFDWTAGLLAELSNQGVARVVLMDEPDTHLDYRAQQRLFESVTRYASAGAQVALATHSLAAINRFSFDRIIRVHRDALRVGRVETVREPVSDEQIIHDIGRVLGIENANVIYEKCFVVVEGDTEQYAMPLLYERWSGRPWHRDGIRFVNAHNNDGVIKFVRFLRDVDRPVIGLIDQDTMEVKAHRKALTRARLQTEGHLLDKDIFLVKPTCFELAFSDGVWARAVRRATNGSRRPTAARLASLRSDPKAFVAFLQEQVGVASKPELARALVDSVSPDEIPACIRDAFDRAYQQASTT